MPAVMHLFRRGFTALLALVLAIALGSCNLAEFKTDAAQIPQIVYSVLSDPKTFNAALSKESPNIFSLTYEGLIDTNGLTGEVEPALAESWEISPDNLQIIYTLREGLKWSDGEPLTADDVVFSYNQIYLNEEIPTNSRDSLRVGEKGEFPQVRKLDGRRIEFTVPEPFAPFLRATGLSILPAHVLQAKVTTKDADGSPIFLSMWGTDTDPAEIIVNGPYQLTSYTTSERVIFERNPYYWRQDQQGKAQPYIDRVIWQIVESTDNSLLQFRSGGLDLISVTPEYFSLLKREDQRSNFTIYNGGPAPGTIFISFNLNQGSRNGKPLVDPIKSSWFNTLEFRQAVAYGLDRQTMVNNIYQGLGAPQTSPISVQSPYYTSPEEGLPTYDYNPEKAMTLLQQAGFKYDATGQLLDGAGNRVRFTLITNSGNKIREALGAQIKQDLSKIGIKVDFQPIAFNALVDKLSNTLDWDCHLIGFTGGIEPNNGANVWQPKGSLHAFNQTALPGQPEIEGWKVADWEAEIGRLYTQGAQELDEEKRKAIYARTQYLAQEYLPFIYLINPLSMAAIRNKFAGLKYSALGGSLWNIHEIEIIE
ncbi:MAG: ABC transporter substrate-binding protein [Cyanothece sp. SIO1E1]|nr:ABC transporter substrate-binding protein [Cyanothece sp. SIO1E1]